MSATDTVRRPLIGITAGPFVANRMRRMFGSSSSLFPISVIWRALS